MKWTQEKKQNINSPIYPLKKLNLHIHYFVSRKWGSSISGKDIKRTYKSFYKAK